MGKVWAVAKREYFERVRSKWFLFATIFGPVMLAVVTILPAWLSVRSLRTARASHIVIVDATGIALGQRVASGLSTGALGDTAAAVVRIVAPGEATRAESTATKEVMAKSFEGYLVLDSTTVAGSIARYAGRNASTIPDMERIEGAVRESIMAMRLQNAGMDAERVKAFSKIQVKMATERITDSGRGGSGKFSVVFAFVIAFLLYTSVLLYGQSILRGVIEEKTTRVAEVVVASVSPDALLAGKVLGVGAVGLTQVGIWVLSGIAMFRFRAPIMERLGIPVAGAESLPSVSAGTAVLLVVFFVLGFVFYSSLFAAVGAMVSSDSDAQQAATPVTLLAVTAIIFVQPVILNPTSRLAQVMSWLPFSSPIIMPVRLALIPVPWTEVAAVIAIAVAGCTGAVWLAARIYRVGILMYGKRPGLGELRHWIKQSR